MADDLPNKLTTFERNDIRDNYRRTYTIRFPAADTTEGTQPWVDASSIADAEVPNYGNAQTIANNASLANKSIDSLIAYADTIGLVPNILPATGSTGFVRASATAGGATIVAGQQGKDNANQLYQCTVTGVYGDGAAVPIAAISTGPNTNLDPGTIITWQAPPPGIGPSATVIEQSNGSGMTGGRNDESREDLINRIRDFQENRPASGNDAAFQLFIQNIRGIAIQKAFTYPAINGCGSIGICFLLLPASSGGSRIPNATQISQVQNLVLNAFPADDSDFFCTVVPSNLFVALQVDWAKGALGWQDASPWPAWNGEAVVVDATGINTPTTLRLTTGTAQAFDPQVGQVIGFFDRAEGLFRRKQILAVTVLSPGTQWDLTFDTVDNASNDTFTPATGDPASPWSDSLQLLVSPLRLYFDGLGPGEQVGSFYDAGLRQRRQPEGTAEWSSEVTSRMLGGLYSLTAINNVEVLSPSLPYQTPIGTPGVSSNLTQLGTIAAYP